MEFIKVKDICDIKTGKYDANHSKEDGKYKFFTCALLPMKADTYSFDGKLVMLPGNGANLGEVMYYEGKIEAYQRTYVLHNINIEAKFLYYFLKLNWKKYILRRQIGSATNYMKLEDILNFEVPNISLDMQKKIIDILDGAQRLIDKRKKQIEELDLLVKSKFIEMFGEVDDYVPLSKYINSLTAGKSLAGETECVNKVLNTGSISYDFFDKTQVKNLPKDYLPKEEHLVNKGDVLISRMNTAELVGATAYVWNVNDNTYIPDRLWKANFNDNINPIFVWQLLIQNRTKEKIRRIASGTSGSMKNISKTNLLNIEVIYVDICKQNQFADFVKQVDKLKFEMEKSLKELENNFNSLMNKAFKGELF
ncbi:MAG: restriction endonuclease subunit S [Clostridium perfringens]|nr:restriction endonuclease subunit S [Clostridium perfringens]MDU5542945.1 restriction endonuclease subunit S [Clostridium perfringens]